MLLRAGVTGSAVVGDFEVEIKVGGLCVSTLPNSKLGMAADADDMFPILVPVPANTLLQVVVTTAATTNPVSVALEFSP